jgi:hypothetical protein
MLAGGYRVFYWVEGGGIIIIKLNYVFKVGKVRKGMEERKDLKEFYGEW